VRAHASYILALAAVIGVSGCTGRDRQLQQHREKFQSLGASTRAIADAWLAGTTSGTYTATALEQTFLLLEQERHALGAAPELLGDPRGAELSQTSERLARTIASMVRDVRAADPAAVRRQMDALPGPPAGSQ
jgi:hypothetical protein